MRFRVTVIIYCLQVFTSSQQNVTLSGVLTDILEAISCKAGMVILAEAEDVWEFLVPNPGDRPAWCSEVCRKTL